MEEEKRKKKRTFGNNGFLVSMSLNFHYWCHLGLGDFYISGEIQVPLPRMGVYLVDEWTPRPSWTYGTAIGFREGGFWLFRRTNYAVNPVCGSKGDGCLP